MVRSVDGGVGTTASEDSPTTYLMSAGTVYCVVSVYVNVAVAVAAAYYRGVAGTGIETEVAVGVDESVEALAVVVTDC